MKKEEKKYIVIFEYQEEELDGFKKTWIRRADTFNGLMRLIKEMSGSDWKLIDVYYGERLNKYNLTPKGK